MTVIENANQFVAAAVRNGVDIKAIHAAIALKYFDRNHEQLVRSDDYKLWLEPKNDPGNGCEYNVAELFMSPSKLPRRFTATPAPTDIPAKTSCSGSPKMCIS